MLLLAALGLLVSLLLAIELLREARGMPAFLAVALLCLSPVFFSQAIMAQLDAPAMLFTALALLLFVQNRVVAAAAACVALVLVKETGVVAPVVFGLWLVHERRWRDAAWFLSPVATLGAWIGILIFHSRAWRIAWLLLATHVVILTAFGGGVLERYLLPVLPVLYTAMAAGLSLFPRRPRLICSAALLAGLASGIFINPPYPFPYEGPYGVQRFCPLAIGSGGPIFGAGSSTICPIATRGETRQEAPFAVENRMDRGGQWIDIYVNPRLPRTAPGRALRAIK
jgi:hypothetical protein